MKRLLLLALLAVACEESSTGACKTNAECPAGSQCNTTSGLCECVTDEACKDGEFCNAQRICQLKSGCTNNDECSAVQFCDLRSGACLPRTACGADTHCDLSTVCDRGRSVCVEGCFDEGDCPLYQVCERTGTSSTSLGRCVSGKCGDRTFCPLGERCVAGTCRPNTGSSNCLACDPGMSAMTCGAANYCLINAGYDPMNPRGQSPNYCGVECQDSEDCGNGYRCSRIVLITERQHECQNNTECGGMGRTCARSREDDLKGFCTCAVDADCALDRQPATCAGSCSGLGVIPCLRNDQCQSNNCVLTNKTCVNPPGQRCNSEADCQPQPLCSPGGLGGGMVCITTGLPCQTSEQCMCVNGTCAFTGRPCQTGADCNLRCEGGGCVLGAGCGPIEGISCEDLR